MKCPVNPNILGECIICPHYPEHEENHECRDWDEHDHGCVPCEDLGSEPRAKK